MAAGPQFNISYSDNFSFKRRKTSGKGILSDVLEDLHAAGHCCGRSRKAILQNSVPHGVEDHNSYPFELVDETTFRDLYRNGNTHSNGDTHTECSSYCHEKGQLVDNSRTVLHKMAALFGDQDLSDIQIIVRHKVFHAHKLVLCCSSDVFRVMLTNPTWPESQRNKIILKEEPECIHVFEGFLRYLYCGTIKFDNYNVLPVLMLADKYNVSDLQEVCIQYMCNHVVSVVQHNHAVSWLQYGRLCGHQKLMKTCEEFIRWNFHKVLATQDFLLMERNVLIHFLQHSDLVIPDEFSLYQGVIRWLLYQQQHYTDRPNQFKDLVLDLLANIRFPMIGLSQLHHLEKDPFIDSYKTFYLEKISNAVRYHTLTMEARNHLASVSGESVQIQPRNYTNETWSTILAIDHYSMLPQHDVRPIIFWSPVSGSKADENRIWDWHVDLYPKGIHFERCLMIGLWRNMEISGAIYKTVRLTLTAKNPEVRRVEVAVLLTGVQDNIEYIKMVVQRKCTFDKETRMYNLNDIVPYEDLNSLDSTYLSGANGDSFKVTIVIKPA